MSLGAGLCAELSMEVRLCPLQKASVCVYNVQGLLGMPGLFSPISFERRMLRDVVDYEGGGGLCRFFCGSNAGAVSGALALCHEGYF